MPTDLWPADFGVIQEKPPVAILREQGQALGSRTGNVVVGRIETRASGNRIQHSFFIYCTPLSFRIEFLFVEHGISFYPAVISYEDAKKTKTVNDAEQFSEALKEIFALDATKRLIASLIAQSEA